MIDAICDIITPQQIREIVVHAVRSETFLGVAIDRIKPESDFYSGKEAAESLVYAVTAQLFRQVGRLPSQHVLTMECQRRCAFDPDHILNQPEIQKQLFDLINECYLRNNLNVEYAVSLVRDFLWERRVKARILKLGEQGGITEEVIDGLIDDACLARFNTAASIDTMAYAAGSLLANPNMFAPTQFISTGYKQLDGALGGGLAAGEMSALIGPTGVGKTATMVNLALNMVARKTPTLIVSLEMVWKDIMQMAVAIRGSIPRMALRAGISKPEHQERVRIAYQDLAVQPLFIVDRFAFPGSAVHAGPPDMQAVGAVIERFVKAHTVRVVFLDYLAKIGPFEDEELRRMAILNDWCFTFARQHKIHIVALGQQNKASFSAQNKKTGKRSAGLHDAKGGIENVADPDNIIFLIRDDWNTETPKDPAELRIVVQKARQGPGGETPVLFHRKIGLVESKLPAGLLETRCLPIPTSREASATVTRPLSYRQGIGLDP